MYGDSDRRAIAVATSNEFVVVGNEGGEVIVYNGATGSQVATMSHQRMGGRTGNIESLDVSRNGATVLVSTTLGLLFRWSCLPVWDEEKEPENEAEVA